MPPLHDCHTSYQFTKSSEDQQTQIIEKNNVVPCCYTDLTYDTVRYNGMDHENIIEDIVHFKSWPGKESGRETIQGPRNDGVYTSPLLPLHLTYVARIFTLARLKI